jgi:hypothetical protein
MTVMDGGQSAGTQIEGNVIEGEWTKGEHQEKQSLGSFPTSSTPKVTLTMCL